MRLYLAGPITGHHDYRDQFRVAAHQLADAGHVPINPAEIGERAGWCWEDYMRAALMMMLQCQGVALLPGWTGSRGARIEEGVAQSLAMPAHPLSWWVNRHGDLGTGRRSCAHLRDGDPAGKTARNLIEQARAEAMAKHSPSSVRELAAEYGALVCLPILVEEVGEVATAIAEVTATQLAAELAQVAAVATLWLEGMVMRGDA